MQRVLLPLVLVVSASLALSACAVTVTPSAAKVGTTTISVGRVNSVVNDALSSKSFTCLLSQQYATAGAGLTATYGSRFVAQQLSLLVTEIQLRRLAAAHDLAVTTLATTLATSQLESGLSGSTTGGCTTPGAQVLSSLPPEYRSLLTSIQEHQDLLSAWLAGVPLTPAGVRDFSAHHPGITRLACVSAILVASRAKAVAAAAEIAGGKTFAAVAKAKSLDTQSGANGGALGCVYPGQFAGSLVKTVSTLPIGTVSAPIKFGSNYVLLEITQRQQGTTSGAALALVSSKASAEVAFVNGATHPDTVWVNTRYGHWGKVQGQYQVVSPAGPLNAAVLNPTAITPLGDTYR